MEQEQKQEALFQKADKLKKEKNYHAAIEIFSQSLKECTKPVDRLRVWHKISSCQRELNENKEVASTLDAALKALPTNNDPSWKESLFLTHLISIYNNRALLCNEDHQQAKGYFLKALNLSRSEILEPDSESLKKIYDNLVTACERLSEIDEAIYYIKELLKLDPEDQEARKRLLKHKDEKEKGGDLYQQGKIAQSKGDKQKAIQLFKESLEKNVGPVQVARAWLRISHCCRDLKKDQEADSALETVHKTSPELQNTDISDADKQILLNYIMQAYTYSGIEFKCKKEYKEAHQQFTKAIKLYHSLPPQMGSEGERSKKNLIILYEKRLEVLISLQQWSLAKQDADSILELKPGHLKANKFIEEHTEEIPVSSGSKKVSTDKTFFNESTPILRRRSSSSSEPPPPPPPLNLTLGNKGLKDL